MEDFTLRSSREGQSSSSNISSTLLLFLHRLQVHLASVLCPLSTLSVMSQCHYRDTKLELRANNVLYATFFVGRGARALHRRKPNVLVALQEISETCWPHSTELLVIESPRFLADRTCFSGCWCREKLKCVWLLGIRGRNRAKVGELCHKPWLSFAVLILRI